MISLREIINFPFTNFKVTNWEECPQFEIEHKYSIAKVGKMMRKPLVVHKESAPRSDTISAINMLNRRTK